MRSKCPRHRQMRGVNRDGRKRTQHGRQDSRRDPALPDRDPPGRPRRPAGALDSHPLIITHGYPSSVVEFMDIVGPLTDPASHGGDATDAFHVVAPSIPGFGFSTPVRQSGWEMARTARAFAKLLRRLGYGRYGAQGGDVGAGVVGMLAGLDGDHVAAVHTNSDPLGVIGALDYLPEDAARLAGPPEEDRAAVERTKAISEEGSGYLKVQSNRPQTIAYSLTDSPAGQLAWIVENFKEWTDQAAELPEDAL